MTKYLKIAYAVALSVLAQVSEYAMSLIARLPGTPDFRSVDYVLSGFDKLQARLAAAQAVANSRGERYSDLADQYDEMSEAAFAEADRAAKVQARLGALLR
jgi:hypothetical protein